MRTLSKLCVPFSVNKVRRYIIIKHCIHTFLPFSRVAVLSVLNALSHSIPKSNIELNLILQANSNLKFQAFRTINSNKRYCDTDSLTQPTANSLIQCVDMVWYGMVYSQFTYHMDVEKWIAIHKIFCSSINFDCSNRVQRGCFLVHYVRSICINIAVCRRCRLIILFDSLHFSEKFSGSSFVCHIRNLKKHFSTASAMVSIIYRCASVLSMPNIRCLCTFVHCAYLICISLSVFQVKIFTPFDLYQTRLTIFRLSSLLCVCVCVHCCYCCPLTLTTE